MTADVRPLPGWRAYLLAMAAVVAVTGAVVGLHVWRYQTLSPIDELQHIDYTFRMRELAPPHRGDLVGQDAMRAQACRGIDAAVEPRRCTPLGSYEADTFQEGGQNTAWAYLPGYYLVAAGFGKLVNVLTPVDDVVNAARLAGILWSAAAATLLIAACRRVRISAPVAGCIAALMVSQPVVLHSTSTLNPDGATLLGGGLLLLLPFWWGDAPPAAGKVTDGLASAAALGLKVTNVVALGPAALFRVLLRYDRLEARQPLSPSIDTSSAIGVPEADLAVSEEAAHVPWWRRFVQSLPAAVPVVLGGAAVFAATAWWTGYGAKVPPEGVIMLQRMTVHEFPTDGMVQTMFTFGPLTGAYLAPVLRQPAIVLLAAAIALAALVCLLSELRRRTPIGRLALSVGIGILVGGPLLTMINYFGSSTWIGGVPSRYFECLLIGIAMVAAAVTDRHRAARYSLYGATGLWVSVLVVYLARG
jgi:hypothetical protein